MESQLNLNNENNLYYVKQLNEINTKIIRIESEMKQLGKIDSNIDKISKNLEMLSERMTRIEVDQSFIKASLPAKTQWFQAMTGVSAIGAIILAIFAISGK